MGFGQIPKDLEELKILIVCDQENALNVHETGHSVRG